MIDYIKKDMQPNDRFLMLGSEPFTYYLMDQFPSSNHIYPRLISRNSPENRIYQQQAIDEMKNGGQEYILLSVTGLSWQAGDGGINDWYNSAFSYINNNYEPILAFNFDERQYYFNTPNDIIDMYRPNQLVAFKKK
jgi:hypothetical protein